MLKFSPTRKKYKINWHNKYHACWCKEPGHLWAKYSSTVKYNNNKSHTSRQYNCWWLRCSLSIACRRCSNYIFILYLRPDFNRLGKDKCKTRRESFKFGDLMRHIREFTVVHDIPLPHYSWLYINLKSLQVKSCYNSWINGLTHCGLVTPYGDINLGQHWLK